MFNLFSKVLLAGEGKKLKQLQEKVASVNALEDGVKSLSDSQLKAKTSEFKARLVEGETLDDILPEVFAVVREVARRTLNMRHFDVQIMGGIVLHEGKIAEMKTGEGKTLVATLPVCLNALTNKSVHVVTVNDYLAKRDTLWMGRIYHFLGFSMGVLQHDAAYLYDPDYIIEDERMNYLRPVNRREVYLADIVYGTNHEFGFDYLRDNMVTSLEEVVQRDFYYAIVDEVDSILIDEARTPLIISGAPEHAAKDYVTFARIIPQLKKELDYEVNEKERAVTYTDDGLARLEKILGLKDIHNNPQLFHYVDYHLTRALKAYALFKKDVDYIIKDGEVIIVDEFTGRLMFGRRYSEGLHQAIEAKENVRVKEESQTLATITLQNYFRMYEKLAGMTGTAATEADEFMHIYKLETVAIPTNMPMIRVDLPDIIHKTEESKFRAVVDEIVECYKKGQPVLVGTISIEKSEKLSKMLKMRGVPHQVLNAKHHEREAEIVAQAGGKGAITIATNMAGRGVDIILGGNPPDLEEAKEIKELGGLFVLGTERHEARRIDNQLRGRSGRQGDPGLSRFYLSLEDDLMRMFGSDRIKHLMDRLQIPDDMPIEHSMVSKSIETAQRQVESQNFSIRKHVLEYDDVMNIQREVIYRERRRCLEKGNLREQAMNIIADVIDEAISVFTHKDTYPEKWDLDGLFSYLRAFFPLSWEKESLDFDTLTQDKLREKLLSSAIEVYQAREEKFGAEVMRDLERRLMLWAIDSKWREHLAEMDYLREGISLRAIGQKDPLVEYKREAHLAWEEMNRGIKEDFVKYIFHVEIVSEEGTREQVRLAVGGEGASQPYRKAKKIGRNEPCPCGSGLKYKKCCGK